MNKTKKLLPKLKPLQPVRLSSSRTGRQYTLKGTPGKPTKQVVAEIKRLAREGIYVID